MVSYHEKVRYLYQQELVLEAPVDESESPGNPYGDAEEAADEESKQFG